jgi:hypothetical protein
MIDSNISVSGRTIVVAAKIPLRISNREERRRVNGMLEIVINRRRRSSFKLTKLDSSGDAKLNNNTLTLTVKVPTTAE